MRTRIFITIPAKVISWKVKKSYLHILSPSPHFQQVLALQDQLWNSNKRIKFSTSLKVIKLGNILWPFIYKIWTIPVLTNMAYLCLDAQVPSYGKTKFLTNASKEHMWHKIAAASLWACLKNKKTIPCPRKMLSLPLNLMQLLNL